MPITLVPQAPVDAYLRPTAVIDSDHPAVRDLAGTLSAGLADDPVAVTRRCFEWVRDEVPHSHDHRRNPVTCAASHALHHRTGFCYAKSHLLAALLRACGIPAGLCYQRLSIDDNGPPFSLHGLNAVLLPGFGWYRLDPRGNRPDGSVDAQFTPPVERLAYPVRLPGEHDFPEIWPDALPQVVAALRAHATYDALRRNLPDLDPAHPEQQGPDVMHLERATPVPPLGLADLLTRLGPDGEAGFGGTAFSRGECSLDDFLRACVDGEDPAKVPAGFVPQTIFWMVDGGRAVGMVRLRHRLTDRLLQAGGHVGYYVHPAHRGRGHATRALRLALDHLRILGVTRALITVDPTNIPSTRVILANGGTADGQGAEHDTGHVVNRYWIDLTGAR